MAFYGEEDRWYTALDSELDREAEEREARELAHRERLYEKGLPHRPLLTGPTFLCTPCECGGLCERCAA
jgi:hypothetical protein